MSRSFCRLAVTYIHYICIPKLYICIISWYITVGLARVYLIALFMSTDAVSTVFTHNPVSSATSGLFTDINNNYVYF